MAKSQPKEETSLAVSNWTQDMKLVKEIITKGCPDCSDSEFKYLIYMAKSYGLNPLKREIYAVRYGANPVSIFTSRDGLLSIAHRSQQLGSMETVCEMDETRLSSKNAKVPKSATCTIWRKDYDKPYKCTVYYDEYKKPTMIWEEKPKTMLMKVAEATCLRRAFRETMGIYTPDEMPEVDSQEEKPKTKELGKEEQEAIKDDEGTSA